MIYYSLKKQKTKLQPHDKKTNTKNCLQSTVKNPKWQIKTELWKTTRVNFCITVYLLCNLKMRALVPVIRS